MQARRPTVIIMLKEPRPGRVKTRLARDIETIRAAAWFRRESAALVRRLTCGGRWNVVLAVAPDLALGSAALPLGVARVPQGQGDLGARMARLLAASPRPVVLVGSDIPELGAAHIARAFRRLGGSDMVFGPAEDGGFWLVGLGGVRSVPRYLFKGVRWSQAATLSDTIAGLHTRRVAFADRLGDVDTLADLARNRAAVATGGRSD